MKWDTLSRYYDRTNTEDNVYFMITNKIMMNVKIQINY